MKYFAISPFILYFAWILYMFNIHDSGLYFFKPVHAICMYVYMCVYMQSARVGVGDEVILLVLANQLPLP